MTEVQTPTPCINNAISLSTELSCTSFATLTYLFSFYRMKGVDNGPGWVGMGPNCRTGPIHGWIKTAHTEPFLGLGSFGFGSNGFGLNGWFFAGWVSCSPIVFFAFLFKIGVFYGPVVIFLTSQYGQSSNNQNWVPVHDHFLN
jgi:hypothetical protein